MKGQKTVEVWDRVVWVFLGVMAVGRRIHYFYLVLFAVSIAFILMYCHVVSRL